MICQTGVLFLGQPVYILGKVGAILIREQSLSIGETGAEGNELGYETIAFAVSGV